MKTILKIKSFVKKYFTKHQVSIPSENFLIHNKSSGLFKCTNNEHSGNSCLSKSIIK